MGLLTRLGERMLARLAPKADADAACIYLYTDCYSCNRAENVKKCCRNYDNCRQDCYYTTC